VLYIMSALFGWIASLVNDDYMDARHVILGLGATTKSYYDWAKLTAPNGSQFALTYNQDGIYVANMSLNVV
jgi:hypothetical protein